jgi:hypothetical protein
LMRLYRLAGPRRRAKRAHAQTQQAQGSHTQGSAVSVTARSSVHSSSVIVAVDPASALVCLYMYRYFRNIYILYNRAGHIYIYI